MGLLGALFSFSSTSKLFSWPFFNPYMSWMSLDILLDQKGLLFASVVLFISGAVLLFSSFYMEDDLFLTRFILLVVLFVLSMNLLIFIPNMISLLLGWDGLGIVSFCLVIYYQSPKSLAGGMLTALSNRVGDVMILLSIAFMVNNGSWLIINLPLSSYSITLMTLVLIAAMTKSAQIPFSSWLPAAMAAPTPVSALVHSSTLVTAGVFLLIRFYPFLILFPQFKTTLLIISVSTLTMAGMSAMTECDLKKIIALSTLSQLGVMMMSLALGLVELAFFHLLTHAMFKALLFMSAGTLLHLFSHNQDLRGFANLSFQLPFVVSTVIIANLALCGFPFMAGFYSKDLILEFMLTSSSSFFLLCIAMGATFLTAAYSIRLTLTAIWAPVSSPPIHLNNDSSPLIILPLLLLSFFAIVGGAIFNWLYMPSSFTPVIPSLIKLIPLFVTIYGAIIVWLFGTVLLHKMKTFMSYPLTLGALTSMWFFTPLSTQAPLLPSLQFVKTMSFSLDCGWLELLGPQSVPTSSSTSIPLVQHLTNTKPLILFLLSGLCMAPVITHYFL
uniref:NADH-ubiquinone oxidoreductase chain 5 n=1 Tax=Phascolosoma sp. MZK-2017 TaxID=1979532 RepID=A0A1W5YQD2_9ANNE|nr:NADH dehydrogenase subunit 5 [Phascolosoma sp. MZK-2017]